MPNIFANLVFFSWPMVVFWMLKRYPTDKAIFLATTLAILYLPNNFGIDLPFIPPLDRDSLTALSLFVFLFFVRKKVRVFIPGLPTKIILMYFVVVVISVLLNTYPVTVGGKFLPGLTVHDAFSSVVRIFLWMMPFFMGRYFFNSLKSNEPIFKALVVIILIYTLPMLIELRMSPQIHNWIYGYSPGEFIQQMRGDGFRPIVFVGHGLALAFIISTTIIAAFALHKNKVRFTLMPPSGVVIYLLVIIFLCKTLSAMIYALFAMYAIYKLAPSKQIKWALLLAGLILLYPVSKTMDIFPDKEIISKIREYSPERAGSMETRFNNEEILLERALKQPYFGWSGWGRSRIYGSSGDDITITDGKWIIEFGSNGIVGFVFYYLILLMPLAYARKNVIHIQDPKDKVYFSALALILGICIIDSVPNTGMGAMHLLLAGALLGQSELLAKQKKLQGNRNEKSIISQQ
ncbi:MAG: hypothetical protein V4605_06000 [Pseudomonadota bacterium]